MKHFMKPLQNNQTKIKLLYTAAGLLFVLSMLLGLLLGSTSLSLRDLWNAIFESDSVSPESAIFRFVRLPRTCASLICGAALAVSGAIIQGVLANRLASPGIVGVNSGAGLAVTLCGVFGVLGGWRLSLFAFLGAFLSVLLIALGAKKWGASRGTVILMGVAMNSLLGAVSDAIVTFFPTMGIMRNDFRVGDFSFVTSETLIPATIAILITLAIVFTLANELDVLSLGEETAKGLGLNTGKARLLFLLFAAILAGAAVSLAGLLSFIGLLVPHAVRRLGAGASRHLLPLCALFGAGFVTLSDVLARVLFAPYEIPVGIIMAFVGAPFFVFLLVKGKGGHRNA